MLGTFCSNGREVHAKRGGSSSMLNWIQASMADNGEEGLLWRRGLQLCSVSSDASQGSTEGTSRRSWTYGVQNTVFYIVIINKHLQNLLSIFLLFTFFFCFLKKKKIHGVFSFSCSNEAKFRGISCECKTILLPFGFFFFSSAAFELWQKV